MAIIKRLSRVEFSAMASEYCAEDAKLTQSLLYFIFKSLRKQKLVLKTKYKRSVKDGNEKMWNVGGHLDRWNRGLIRLHVERKSEYRNPAYR